MRFSNRPNWKRILLACICLIALVGVARGSYAAYTSQANKRGVVRNGSTENVCFTSNYLQNCAASENSNYAGRTVLYSEEDKKKETISLELEIYNFIIGNEDLKNQRDITYDLEITFQNGGEKSNYTVSAVPDSRGTFTKENNKYTLKDQTLRGRSKNTHKYTLTFPGDDIDKLKITIAATPQNPSVTNNQKLAAIIAPCTGSEIKEFRGEGKYTDEAAGTKPTEYDGFNYEISITSGKAKGTLKWNPDYVEIDKFFLVNLGKTTDEIKRILENGELEIDMDQAVGTGDYLIPFYINIKKTGITIPATWQEMHDQNIITFSAREITNSTDASNVQE